jgi:serine/threonine-protein kinase
VPASSTLRDGFVVGEYVIQAKIGEGGFGVVYKAVHPVIGKPAAIKVLNHQYSSNPEMVARFISEARSVNKIRHRNIVDIFSFGALDDGRRFFVMELLDGMSFDEMLQRTGPMAPHQVLSLLEGVARALDAAHGADVVHRDLKPDNIFMVCENGVPVQAKLLDFGIAKLMSDNNSMRTRTGIPMGTPHYMSPEQCRGRNVDHRTDIYSFGIVLYRALTGKLPFDAADMMDILIAQTTAPATPPSQMLPQLSPALDAPILRMLAKDPAERPQSMLDAFTALSVAAGYSIAGKTPDPSLLTPPPGVIVDGGGRPHAGTISAIAHTGAVALPAKRPMGLIVGGIGALVVAGLAAAVLLRPGAGNDAKPAAQLSAPIVAAKDPPKDPPPPSAAPTVTAATEVSVRVLATPASAKAEVWLGDKKLGDAPGPIKMPKAAGNVSLSVRADGYAPETVEVAGDVDGSVSIKLTRAKPAAAGGPLPAGPAKPAGGGAKPNKDLEPF